MTLTNRGGLMAAASFATDVHDEDARLLKAARRALPPAQQILDAAARPMLTIAADLGSRRRRIQVHCWDEQFQADHWTPPIHSEELKRAYRVIGRAGMDLARQLARRWPVNAVPGILGVITDGIGIAVSGEYPSALTPAWLHDQVAGRARVYQIIPFGSWAQWALLPAAGCPVLQ